MADLAQELAKALGMDKEALIRFAEDEMEKWIKEVATKFYTEGPGSDGVTKLHDLFRAWKHLVVVTTTPPGNCVTLTFLDIINKDQVTEVHVTTEEAARLSKQLARFVDDELEEYKTPTGAFRSEH